MSFPFAREAIARWLACREILAGVERAGHPNITDQFGRVWAWSSKDIYTHDETIAIPRDWIENFGLPSRGLATNPNYARLCDVCKKEWGP